MPAASSTQPMNHLSVSSRSKTTSSSLGASGDHNEPVVTWLSDLTELGEFPEQPATRPALQPFNRARLRHITVATQMEDGGQGVQQPRDRHLAPRGHPVVAGPHTLLRNLRSQEYENREPFLPPGNAADPEAADGNYHTDDDDDHPPSLAGLSTACPSECSSGGVIGDNSLDLFGTDEIVSGWSTSFQLSSPSAWGSSCVHSPCAGPSDRPRGVRARRFRVSEGAASSDNLERWQSPNQDAARFHSNTG